MDKSLDKMAEPMGKERVLKKVRGYVAPTETGTIRTVKPHTKLVEIDVKPEKGQKAETTEVSTRSSKTGTDQLKESGDKIRDLNNRVRGTDFLKGTEVVSSMTLGFYRGGVNTSNNPKLDRKDGLRLTYEEINKSLLDIGFKNGYNLDAKEAMVKITSPEYMRTLAMKANTVEKRLKELGLVTERLDPFTVAIGDQEGKRIYVSNNPLDHITSREMRDELSDRDVNVITGLHQDKMNDFVFYTSNDLDGGMKSASATATYDPGTKKFYHYTTPIASGHDRKSAAEIDKTLKEKIKSKKILPESHRKSIADLEVFEIKAMISERLTTMQNEIEREVKTGNNDAIEHLLNEGNAIYSGQEVSNFFANEIDTAMQKVNDNFTKLAASRTPKSLAYDSPLHDKLKQFASLKDNIIAMITKAVKDRKGDWEEYTATIKKR